MPSKIINILNYKNMHILDSYALNCGAKIDKPYVYTQYFPLGIFGEKYITLQPQSRYVGKQYNYWNEVIEQIYEPLSKAGYKIVQIGGKDEPALAKCIWTQGRTSVSQAAFIVKHSCLHVGVDSFAIHMASGFDRKIVGVYSTNWANCSRPYWTKDDNCVLIEPDRDEEIGYRKPSFKFSDTGTQTINDVLPEKISNAILKLLNINVSVPVETIYAGPLYRNMSVQIIPTSIAKLPQEINHAILRMDLNFDEEILIEQLALTDTHCSIITDKPINAKIIDTYYPKIRDIVYLLKENYSLDFVKQLHQTGKNYLLSSKLDEKALDKIKFECLDYNFVFNREELKEQKEKILKHPIDKLLFKTSKKYLKDGKFYSSVLNVKKDKQDQSLMDFPFHKVEDAPEFWDDLEDFYIVKELD